jgi:16S rRNA G1207 methylase RsmC
LECTRENDVVDVGGGLGTLALTVAKAFPNLHFIVQDSAAVLKQGKQARNKRLLFLTFCPINCSKTWKEQFPEAIMSGRVKLQGGLPHD